VTTVMMMSLAAVTAASFSGAIAPISPASSRARA
jgi:hypothetical protein